MNENEKKTKVNSVLHSLSKFLDLSTFFHNRFKYFIHIKTKKSHLHENLHQLYKYQNTICN